MICPTCKKDFNPEHWRQRYCCQPCQYARPRSGRRRLTPLTERACVRCNENFLPRIATQRYCDSVCQTGRTKSRIQNQTHFALDETSEALRRERDRRGSDELLRRLQEHHSP